MLGSIFSQARSSLLLHAGDEKRLTRPCELDIYFEPELKHKDGAYSNDTPTNIVYENISAARKSVTDTFKGLLSTHEKIGNVYNFFASIPSLETKITAVYEDVMADPYFLLPPTSIAIATVGGAMVAGRGKIPFKRSLYAVVFGATATSVCHPERAHEIATTSYHHTTAGLQNLYAKLKEKTVTEKITESASSEILSDTVQIDTVKSTDAAAAVSAIKEESEKGIETEPFEIVDVTEENFTDIDNIPPPSDSHQEQTEMKIIEIDIVEADVNTDEVVEEIKSKDETVLLDVANESESKLDIQADYGQSSEEDSDMYSTRS